MDAVVEESDESSSFLGLFAESSDDPEDESHPVTGMVGVDVAQLRPFCDWKKYLTELLSNGAIPDALLADTQELTKLEQIEQLIREGATAVKHELFESHGLRYYNPSATLTVKEYEAQQAAYAIANEDADTHSDTNPNPETETETDDSQSVEDQTQSPPKPNVNDVKEYQDMLAKSVNLSIRLYNIFLHTLNTQNETEVQQETTEVTENELLLIQCDRMEVEEGIESAVQPHPPPPPQALQAASTLVVQKETRVFRKEYSIFHLMQNAEIENEYRKLVALIDGPVLQSLAGKYASVDANIIRNIAEFSFSIQARCICAGDVHFSYSALMPTQEMYDKMWFTLNAGATETTGKYHTGYFDVNRTLNQSVAVAEVVHIFEPRHCDPRYITEGWFGGRSTDVMLYYPHEDVYCIVTSAGVEFMDCQLLPHLRVRAETAAN